MKGGRLLAPLIFLCFAFITKPLLGAPEPLLDFSGEKVITGTDYYLLSIFRGPGGAGGLNLFNGRNKSCPPDIIQERLDFLKGLPLRLSYAYDQGVVFVSTDLNIKFSDSKSTCNQSTVWKVDDYDKSTGQWFITNEGVEGNPGAETLESWFKFEKVGLNVYKIVHCPSVCDSCVTLCSDVGISLVNGISRLALSHYPLAIMFAKGNSNATN